jgi:hypothetical protein
MLYSNGFQFLSALPRALSVDTLEKISKKWSLKAMHDIECASKEFAKGMHRYNPVQVSRKHQ